MATSGKTGSKLPGKPTPGMVVGATLTYAAAYYKFGPDELRPALLTILTPLGWYIEWLILLACRAISKRHIRQKKLKGNQKAQAVAEAKLRNPDLPAAQKEDLQNIIHRLTVEEIHHTAYDNPPPPQTQSNSKPGNRR